MSKTLCRLISPPYVGKPVLEGEFTNNEIAKYNTEDFYNVYTLPNHPAEYLGGTVDGSLIDTFEWVFVDFDLKSGTYATKEEFLEALALFLTPTRVVDSGNGIHAYWKVQDLDAMSYLRLQRRLVRHLHTDPATCMIMQLMRLPNTLNTKDKNNLKLCETVFVSEEIYSCEELDKLLPAITRDDEEWCQSHYNRTYNKEETVKIDDTLPPKFGELIQSNEEIRSIWVGETNDRSKNDYRLGHLLFSYGFSKDEARSVLVNSAKALSRSPIHRVSYADNIVSKIWTYENTGSMEFLSESVEDILSRNNEEELKGRRFPCQPFFDGTEHGFRLGNVLGLVAGVGVGKTSIALNIFKGFVERNPDFIHMFVSLEQPGREIADRWRRMCGPNTANHKKVHLLSNYNQDGTYRNLSLTDIQDYILKFQKETNLKVGCVCVDHIGVLRQENRAGEYQGLRDICAQLKSFAIATETMFIIQSQTSRDKAGIGDLELFKDAAYGSQFFEMYIDFLMVAWQPLKRCYDTLECPRLTAYKFAKIRFKSKNDKIIEDQCYRLTFDQEVETFRPMTQMEETQFSYFASQALTRRNKDRKSDLVEYVSTMRLVDGT